MVTGLRRESPDLAEGIRKWSKFLLHSAERVSRITGMADEDVLSDILLSLVKVDELYKNTLYRFQGAVYKSVAWDGCAVKLKTLDSNTKFKREFWTHYSNIEPIRKGKIESAICREIHHQSVDILSANFIAKNGFLKTQVAERVTVKKLRDGNERVSVRPIYDVEKYIHQVDIDISTSPERSQRLDPFLYPSTSEILRYLCDSESNPEESIRIDETLSEIAEMVSNEAMTVLSCLMADPELSNHAVAKVTGMPFKQVSLGRFEVMNAYSFMTQRLIPRKAGQVRPIYLRADQIC